jgi:hypothetical protein
VTIIDGRPLIEDRRAGVHVHVLRSGDAYDLSTGLATFPTIAPVDHVVARGLRASRPT